MRRVHSFLKEWESSVVFINEEKRRMYGISFFDNVREWSGTLKKWERLTHWLMISSVFHLFPLMMFNGHTNCPGASQTKINQVTTGCKRLTKSVAKIPMADFTLFAGRYGKIYVKNTDTTYIFENILIHLGTWDR